MVCACVRCGLMVIAFARCGLMAVACVRYGLIVCACVRYGLMAVACVRYGLTVGGCLCKTWFNGYMLYDRRVGVHGLYCRVHGVGVTDLHEWRLSYESLC
jgi:hypothetical protein